MTPELRDSIRALGPDLNPEMMQGTQRLIAGLHDGLHKDTSVKRDLEYGSDPRHRVDIFTQEGTERAPVLVYVHGGGFVMGDKRAPGGLPFYDNVGDFAARRGWVGATITYRLAPDHPWPAGPEDLGLLVGWLRNTVGAHGGDPDRIFLMGQSAGAVHVASYVAHPRFHAAPGGGIAGALLVSCIYDVAEAQANQFHTAYYGEDASAYAAASTTGGLIDTDVPLLATVSEFDVADFQKQAATFVGRYAAAKGAYPRMLYLAGHNHLSPALAIGSRADTLGPEVELFVASHA